MDRDDKKKERTREEEPVIQADQAVALAYDPWKTDLPRVTASAEGELAGELVRLAAEHGIPIRYDPDLVQVLSKLELGDAIPEEVFVVVAEILAFIYRVNQEYFSDGD